MLSQEDVKSVTVKGTEGLSLVAIELLNFMGEIKVALFFGSMGAGKTTFIKEICKQLKVEDNVLSPTFSIVNEYRTIRGETIFHFDFYRIKDESEAWDLGFEDYLYSGNRCFIEWPEKVPGLIPEDNINVQIKVNTDQSRTFTFQK